ncbi:MAG: hypothetical protein JW804_04705 [Sedimentisphaerales bacterium]|nr:hypothetical protein [Sedimentisphaerales bacterium]
MDKQAIGKKCWVVPDGYIPVPTDRDSENINNYISHECICLLNTSEKDVSVELIFYFEDSNPVIVKDITVAAQRSSHLRIDELLQDGKPVIPKGTPYSLVIKSSDPIVAQMSRLDTTQNNMAFLSTMAFPAD